MNASIRNLIMWLTVSSVAFFPFLQTEAMTSLVTAENELHTIFLEDARTTNIERVIMEDGIKRPTVRITHRSGGERHPLYRVTMRGMMERENLLPTFEKQIGMFEKLKATMQKVARVFAALFRGQIAHAEELIPFITYYDGIEKHLMDHLLYYLSEHQNDDGSFGMFNQYELSADIALLLVEYNRTDSGQFDLLLSYLKNAEPTNNREKAIKARLMVGLGEPYQYLLNDLLDEQNGDTGFGLYEGYESDVLTTMEVVWALWAADYPFSGPLPAALSYVLKQTQPDGSLSYTSGAPPSYYLINKTVEYLRPFQNAVITIPNEGTMSVNDKASLLLSYLASEYDEEAHILNNSTDDIDFLMMLRSFELHNVHLTKQERLRNEMKGRQRADGDYGSWYATVAAMRIFGAPDIVTQEITNVSALQNNATATLALQVHNKGYVDSSDLHLFQFTDKVKSTIEFSLSDFGLVIAPQETMSIEIEYGPSITKHFLGDTLCTFYMEDPKEADYGNNWIEKTFVFGPPPQTIPALPVYYIAHAHPVDNTPGVYLRWAGRLDPYRSSYAVAIRKAGATQWSSFVVIQNDLTDVFIGGFKEGLIYEVTLGVVHQDNKTVSLMPETTFIKTSVNPSFYTGAMTGMVTENSESVGGVPTKGYHVFGMSQSDGQVVYQNAFNGATAAFVETPYYESLLTQFFVPVGAGASGIRFFTRLVPDAEAPVIADVGIKGKNGFTIFQNKLATLFVSGSDNVAVKEADFFYWDPEDTSWRYLFTSSPDEPAATAEIYEEWYVSLPLGSGYKIKAVIRDYQGNESSPKESGPFTVTEYIPVDTDGDGVDDFDDACVFVSNSTQSDYDVDGIGDLCDLPPGDVNGDGSINVLDTQCVVLVSSWEASGVSDTPPTCLFNSDIVLADVNCDGEVGEADEKIVAFLASNLNCEASSGACNTPLPSDIDANKNNILDNCE